MREIKILGAGLSGLTSAINLQKAGYKTIVYEKNSDVGFRFNGDIQGLENWTETVDVVKEFESMNLDMNFDCDPFNQITFCGKKNQSNLKLKKPLYYLIKRGQNKGTFDYGIKKQALELGVTINFNETIDENNADIVATGPIFKEVPGVDKGIVFDTSHKDVSTLVFNDDLAYEGYAYLFITKGKGCMCTVVMDDKKKVTECFEKTKEYFAKKYKFDIKNPKNAGGVGSFSLKHIFDVKHKNKETHYIGERAGLQDFLWGFGMRYAVQSGYLAAKSIIENKNYEKLANKAFNNKLKASVVNRYLWEKLGEKAYNFIINNPKISLFFLRSMHNNNLMQKVIYPKAKKFLVKRYPKLEL